MNKIKISPHFYLSEFQCKGKDCCGNVVKLDEKLLAKLELLRQRIKAPIVIKSGYRCPKHNKAIGSKSTSQHLLGKAVDCHSPRILIKRFLGEATKVFHDGGIGQYRGRHFCHLDTGRKRRWAK